MKIEQCPICSNELETREVAPCIECGALDEEVKIMNEDIKEKTHIINHYLLSLICIVFLINLKLHYVVFVQWTLALLTQNTLVYQKN